MENRFINNVFKKGKEAKNTIQTVGLLTVLSTASVVAPAQNEKPVDPNHVKNKIELTKDSIKIPSIVFDRTKQKEELNLVNTEKDTTTYYLSIEKSGKVFDSIKFFPREVTLAPSESQIIVVQCQYQKEALEGESIYYLHFKTYINKEEKTEKEIKIKIVVVH